MHSSRAAGRRGRPQPLLVTGVPRSGTTWLARQLAGAAGSAMTGREPMNPGGGQYRLGGTLEGWARLTRPTPAQASALRHAYTGTSPRVYGKYGHRQWVAPLPWTRVVVKDPFAVLSVEAVARTTGALPVLVYRHPAAVLSSYRRMGWLPDVLEVDAAVPAAEQVGHRPGADEHASVAAMGWFWATLNAVALADLRRLGGGVVVSHEELAAGGEPALRVLFDACGLRWTADARSGAGVATGAAEDDGALHRLDRDSGEVASAWRRGVAEAELVELDAVAGGTFADLQAARLRVA